VKQGGCPVSLEITTELVCWCTINVCFVYCIDPSFCGLMLLIQQQEGLWILAPSWDPVWLAQSRLVKQKLTVVAAVVAVVVLFAEQDLQNAAVGQSADHTRSLRGQAATAWGKRGRGRGQTGGSGRGRGGRGRGVGMSTGSRGRGGSQRRAKTAKRLTYVCCRVVCFVYGMWVQARQHTLFMAFLMWQLGLLTWLYHSS